MIYPRKAVVRSILLLLSVLLGPRHFSLCSSIWCMLNADTEGGLDRRCYFEDGDSEDLSLSQLRNLALLDPEVAKKDANASAAVGAKSVDVFDFEDDEQRTVLHCGVGNEKSKTNVKGMPERITRNAAQIVSKMKNWCDSFVSFWLWCR